MLVAGYFTLQQINFRLGEVLSSQMEGVLEKKTMVGVHLYRSINSEQWLVNLSNVNIQDQSNALKVSEKLS